MNKNGIVVIVVVLVVLAGLGGFMLLHKSNTTTNTQTNPTNSQSSNTTTPSNSSSNTPTQTSAVTIEDMAFSPKDITVKKGTTVTWTNKDSISHTVTADKGEPGPASGTLKQGDTYTFTYNTVGTFAYHCEFHSSMTGTVVVTE